MDAQLVLEDGTVFPGRSVGATGVAAGEACFTTASTGYEQAVTDPSYARQVLTFASPLVGNYGVDEALLESSRVWTEGVVMRRARPTWSEWLARRGVVAVEEVDTRALVRRLREDGAMRCALGTAPAEELHARALAQPHLDWPRMLEEPGLASPPPALDACVTEPFAVGAGPRVVVLDLGCKRSIVRRLVESGVEAVVVPGAWDAERRARARARGGARRQRPRRPGPARRAGRDRARPARAGSRCSASASATSSSGSRSAWRRSSSRSATAAPTIPSASPARSACSSPRRITASRSRRATRPRSATSRSTTAPSKGFAATASRRSSSTPRPRPGRTTPSPSSTGSRRHAEAHGSP